MRSSLYALLYLCRHNDRDHPEDKRQEVKKGAHDGDNDDQAQEVLWPVIVWVLRYGRRKGRNLHEHTDNDDIGCSTSLFDLLVVVRMVE